MEETVGRVGVTLMKFVGVSEGAREDRPSLSKREWSDADDAQSCATGTTGANDGWESPLGAKEGV